MLALFHSISWLLIWMVSWFGWWGILYIRLPKHNDYIIYAERDIIFFFIGSLVWLLFLPPDVWVTSFFALLIIGAICTGLGTYIWFLKKHDSSPSIKNKEKLVKFLTTTQHERAERDWLELNPRYLYVKAVEIVFQQLGILALWHSIATGFIPTLFNDHILTLMILFTFVHIPMLIFLPWKYSRNFIFASIFGSFIFGLIFEQFSYSGVVLAYIFHFFFYVSLPDMSGLFTSVGKKIMREKIN